MSVASDLRVALRLMRKQPVLTLTAVIALATGIGLATTGFTFLEAVVWARLPFDHDNRFVMIEARQQPEGRRASLDLERFRAIARGTPALEHLGAFRGGALNLLLPSGEVAFVTSAGVTPGSSGVLHLTPILGRALGAEDGLPGAPEVAILRESLWRRSFSADRAVIGSTANFSGVVRTIVGVMPDSVEVPNSPEVWIPLTDPAGASIFGILRAGQTADVAGEQAAAAVTQIASKPGERPIRVRVLPFAKALGEGLDLLNAALVAVLVLVLVVISANVANLILARTLSRSSELSVRVALGATRARLVGQIFVEVLLLGAVAAAIGLFASQATLRWIRLTITEIPFWIDLTASPRTVTFVVIITLLASAVSGILPALRASRRNTATALAASSRRVATGFGRASAVMIAVQIALSISALQSALVFARGVAGYMEGMPNAPSWPVLTARVVLAEDDDAFAGRARLIARFRQMPQVRAAGLSTSLPRLSPPAVMTTVRDGVGAPQSGSRAAPVVAASEGFLETLGARPLTGRLFSAADFEARALPVAIVNEPFAQKFFAGANPVGRHLRVLDPDFVDNAEWREIIGVVADLGLSAGDEQLAGGFYIPLGGETVFHASLALIGGAGAFEPALRSAVAAVDPRILVRDIRPLEEVGSEDRAIFAGFGAALTGLGGVALLLSVIGVYAMLSFSVVQRTREIAVRCALGASRWQILSAILGRAAAPVVAGTVIGPMLGGLLIAGRGIFAFRLPADLGPWSAPALAALMIAAGAVASWIPARRLLGINTADALRSE